MVLYIVWSEKDTNKKIEESENISAFDMWSDIFKMQCNSAIALQNALIQHTQNVAEIYDNLIPRVEESEWSKEIIKSWKTKGSRNDLTSVFWPFHSSSPWIWMGR